MSEVATELPGCRTARIRLEFPFRSSPERVWRAFVEEAGAWWPKEFDALPEPAGFRIEPRAGGRAYEYAEDGSELLWFTVIHLQPGKVLEAVGTSRRSTAVPSPPLCNSTWRQPPRARCSGSPTP